MIHSWITNSAEDRGISEAVSQAMIFMLIISSIGIFGGMANPIIDQTRNTHTAEQTISSFDEINSISNKYRMRGSSDKFTTANYTVPFNTYDGTLATTTEPTKINLPGYAPIYSDTMRLKSSNYSVVYDTGIIHYQSGTQSTTYQTPIDSSRVAQDALVLVTHDIKDDFISDTTQQHQLILSQKRRPEVGQMSSGKIKITTHNDGANGWINYLQNLDFIDDGSITTNQPSNPQRVKITADISGSDIDVYHQKIVIN